MSVGQAQMTGPGNMTYAAVPNMKKEVKPQVADGEVVQEQGNVKRGRPSKAVAKRIDWDAAKTEYIEGVEQVRKNVSDPEERLWPTLAEIATRYDANVTTVRKKSMNERWPEQRASYQARLAHTRRQRRIQSLTKEAVEFDGRLLQSAKLGMTMVQARLGEIARDMQIKQALRTQAEARVAAGLVVDPKDWKTAIDARELNTLGQAATTFASLAAKALGEDVIRHEHSGVDGAPIEMEVEQNVTVTAELQRDDPDRMVAVLEALQRAKMFEDDNIINGTIAEDDEDDDDN